MEDHVAIRALLRRRSVTLVSVTENLEETASGRLVEGIHALMAEFYSANLAREIKKGMSQKAKMGGWPHSAPLGYTNVRETISGRQVAHIVVDPRAPHITGAFELYATGEWTLERLVAELDHRGLRNRARGPARVPSGSLPWPTSSRTGAYAGIVSWEGIEYPGLHQPLTDTATFNRVQDLLAARRHAGRGAPPQPLLEGHAVLRGVRAGPVLPGIEGSLRVPYCPGRRTGTPPVVRSPTWRPVTSKPKSSRSTSESNSPSRGSSGYAKSGSRDHRPPASQCRRAKF